MESCEKRNYTNPPHEIYFNLDAYDAGRTDGMWQIPVIKASYYKPTDLVGFNYLNSANAQKRGAGIHFYLDDYQFERIWRKPKLYIEKLKKFSCVCSPGFTLASDTPRAMQLWNVYRSHLLAQMMQDAGIEVIPTIQFCDHTSYFFCFDGIEPGGTIALSTVGLTRGAEKREMFADGARAAISRLKPSCIVLYGVMPKFDFGGTEVINIPYHSGWSID